MKSLRNPNIDWQTSSPTWILSYWRWWNTIPSYLDHYKIFINLFVQFYVCVYACMCLYNQNCLYSKNCLYFFNPCQYFFFGKFITFYTIIFLIYNSTCILYNWFLYQDRFSLYIYTCICYTPVSTLPAEAPILICMLIRVVWLRLYVRSQPKY